MLVVPLIVYGAKKNNSHRICSSILFSSQQFTW